VAKSLNFCIDKVCLSGVPVRVDPRPVGHAPPREEAMLQTVTTMCGRSEIRKSAELWRDI